ncbi:hypothetical protein LWI29_001764 [Acer saccharum]|uniref:Uncharacterized protein n=1 Tax=Acer saccharum TaxID=4024 RepID=A0AA39VVZ4_ACESA|nr:hypothetical protein LWI29_001764 [Acer saccharum]
MNQRKLSRELGDNFSFPTTNNKDHSTNHDLKIFNFQTIVAAKDNFSSTNKLGEVGFGPVNKMAGELGLVQVWLTVVWSCVERDGMDGLLLQSGVCRCGDRIGVIRCGVTAGCGWLRNSSSSVAELV